MSYVIFSTATVMLHFLLFTKRVYFNGNWGVWEQACTQKLPPFSLSLSTWDQSSFHYKSLPFYFHYVRHLHTIFYSLLCVSRAATAPAETTFHSLALVAIYVWWRKINFLIHIRRHYSTYTYDNCGFSLDGVHYNAWKYHVDIWHFIMQTFYHSCSLSRVCMRIFAIFTLAFVPTVCWKCKSI